MTRDEIMAMEAGLEMDIAVERQVFGWRPKRIEDHYRDDCPSYSTDISAAWEVVEKMQAGGWIVDIELDPAEKPCVMVIRKADLHDATIANASTAPLAICRAALLATLAKEPA